MILTLCTACAAPLPDEPDDAVRCAACETRYCSDRCLRYHAHRGGHDDECEDIANGGGAMSQDARENLFQPFFRGKPEESKQGLGMGLYIVSEIVSAHGGTIDVVSTDEETRFTVSVPG